MSKRGISFLSKLALLTATIIWGSTFFIMEGTIKNIEIYTLLAFRFSLSALILGIVLFKKLKTLNKEYLLFGFIMGLFVVLAYIFQTFGLADEGTTPGKNAFLTAIYCIIVPFISWAVTKEKPDSYNIISAILCLLGIALVSTSGNDFSSICKGDLLTLLGGIFFALHLVAVSIFAKNRDILLLTMLQFFFAAVFSWILALFYNVIPKEIDYTSAVSIIYLAVVATCICYILQNVGQKYTSPTSAALILSLEAVFGVIFSIIFTEEKLNERLILGFAIIFISIIISETKPKLLSKPKR